MGSDPIVDEVHEIRAKLLAECGGDLNKLMEKYAVAEKQYPAERLVTLDEFRRRHPRNSVESGGHRNGT